MSEKKYSKEHTMSEMELVICPFCGNFMRTKRALFPALSPFFVRACGVSFPIQGAKCTQKMCRSYADGEKFASNACQTARK